MSAGSLSTSVTPNYAEWVDPLIIKAMQPIVRFPPLPKMRVCAFCDSAGVLQKCSGCGKLFCVEAALSVHPDRGRNVEKWCGIAHFISGNNSHIGDIAVCRECVDISACEPEIQGIVALKKEMMANTERLLTDALQKLVKRNMKNRD